MYQRQRSALFAALALFVSATCAPLAGQSETPSVYERMGGYDVIAAFIDDFISRFDADAELRPFLRGLNASEGVRVRQHLIDFFCAQTGGPCAYHGRDMVATHEGLGIESAHFDAVLDHMSDALEAQGVASREREELLAMLRELRGQIVGG